MKRLCLLVFCVFGLAGCMSDPASIGKVTDPADPRFDPMKFSYLDYKGTVERQEIFPKLFPKGTDKSFVDKVLVEVGGAFARKRDTNIKYPDWTKYNYIYRGTNSYRKLMQWGEATENIVIYYDGNNKVAQIAKGPKFLLEPEKEN